MGKKKSKNSELFLDEEVTPNLENMINRYIQLQYVKVPFGKFNGMIFCQIPLSYLDRILAEVQNTRATWVTERAREWVSICMDLLMNLSQGGDWGGIVPDQSSGDMPILAAVKRWLQDLKDMKTDGKHSESYENTEPKPSLDQLMSELP